MLGNKEDKLGQAEGDGFRIGRGCGLSSGAPLESLGVREADIYTHQCHCLWHGAVTCLQGFLEVAIIVYDFCGSLIPLLTRWALWKKDNQQEIMWVRLGYRKDLGKNRISNLKICDHQFLAKAQLHFRIHIMFEFCPYFTGEEPFLTSLLVHVKDRKYE